MGGIIWHYLNAISISTRVNVYLEPHNCISINGSYFVSRFSTVYGSSFCSLLRGGLPDWDHSSVHWEVLEAYSICLLSACESSCAKCPWSFPEACRSSADKATEISQNFSLSVEEPLHLLEPINSTFYHTAHEFLKQAIFPSYFHGKCQNPTTGINPPGCPNPNCPVICGTPGSLVFHYSTLQTIVHAATKANYKQATNPSSLAFSETLSRVLRAGNLDQTSRPPLRFAHILRTHEKRYEHSTNRTLSSILQKFSGLLDARCDNPQKRSGSSLCDWRDEMIPYILSFPWWPLKLTTWHRISYDWHLFWLSCIYHE